MTTGDVDEIDLRSWLVVDRRWRLRRDVRLAGKLHDACATP